jgi:hypothetical protein
MQLLGEQLRQFAFKLSLRPLCGFRNQYHQSASFPWRNLVIAGSQQQAYAD